MNSNEVDLGIGILGTAYELPQSSISLEAWAMQTGYDETLTEQLRTNGMATVLQAGYKPLEQWVINSSRKALDASGLEGKDIDLVLYFHTLASSVPHCGKSIIAQLTEDIGLSRAKGFSIAQQNCVSYLAALDASSALIKAYKQVSNILIVGADIVLNEKYRPIETIGFQNDGGAAIVVSRRALEHRLLNVSMTTYGEYYQGVNGDPEKTRKLNQMYYLSAYKLLKRLQTESRYRTEDIKLILPHNVNLPGWRRVLGSLKMSENQLYAPNISKIGHIFGCDGIINLHDAVREGLLKKGDLYIVFSMGYGGCFGAALFRY
jgi:3-oxoacyl-[acyl-carrier-protein] synthase-3